VGTRWDRKDFGDGTNDVVNYFVPDSIAEVAEITPTARSGRECKVVFKVASTALRRRSTLMDYKGPKNRDGMHQITLLKFDAEAVLIVLDILHGQSGDYAIGTSSYTMERITFFAEQFACKESVAPFVKSWVNKNTPPTNDLEEAYKWLIVADTFDHYDLRQQMMRLIMTFSTGPPRTSVVTLTIGVAAIGRK
jgi:hypothetical protein